MKRVIIVGSPRSNGRSAHLAEMLFEANIDERPEDELFLVPISEIEVGPCIGCGACKKPSEVIFQDDEGNEVTELRHRCIFDDDMQTLYDLLDEADELTIVCPVYFSGTPAPMKCVLDRLQPYFWPYCANGPREPKRPLTLHVIGEGGDPHGYDPLVSEVRGSTALAGFRIERIMDWVGKISPQGEILAEANEIVLWNAKTQQAENTVDQDAKPSSEPSVKQRPKLSFSESKGSKPEQAKSAEGSRGRGSAKAAGKSSGKPSGKPVGKSADKPTGNPAGKSAGKPANKPAGKPASRSAGKSQPKRSAKSKGSHRG